VPNASRGGFAAPISTEARVETASLDAAVLTVAASVDRWAATSATSRGALLAQVIDDLGAAAPDWHAASCHAKGLDPASYEGGEELVAGVGVVARYVQQLRASLREIAADGRPRIPGTARHAPGGRMAVGVVL
jgi:acyl-CoA reductase-like NAD-dependent aldehyde dehydrogenase